MADPASVAGDARSKPRRSGFGRRFALCVGFFLFGILTVFALNGALREREPTLGEAVTLRHAPECEVLFIGSSFVGLQVLNAVVDAEAARLGYSLHSCKYAQVALFGFELRYRLERLLAFDWPQLKLVVVDLQRADIEMRPANWWNPRHVEWHSVDVLPWVWRRYLRDPRELAETLPVVRVELLHVLARYARAGDGLERLQELELARRLGFLASRAPELPARMAPGKPAARHGSAGKRQRVKEQAAHTRRISKLRAARRGFRERREHADSEWPMDLRRAVRGHGHEALFFYAPAWVARPMPEPAAEDGLIVLDFQNLDQYPYLYERRVRGFTQHLTPEGSARFSKAISRRLIEIWDRWH